MEKLLRPKSVCAMLGISIPTLYRISKNPEFPSKVKISPQAVGFYQSEILDWMESRKEEPEKVTA